MSSSDIEAIVADTDRARHFHYRLRYQVFCLETGFEDAARYPDEEEKDEFDDRSVQFLMRHKASGDWLATSRLVLPDSDPLPIENYCELTPENGVVLEKTAEVSRLLIATEVRRRRCDGRRSRPARQRLRETANLLRDLIRAIAAYCMRNDIPSTAFFITPALARILGRMSIELTQIGPPTRHRGIRVPYLTDVEQVFDTLSRLIIAERGIAPVPYRLFSHLALPREMEEVALARFGT